jgi:metal-responsive CopG/Arc/MetJ family transcriptional regulator
MLKGTSVRLEEADLKKFDRLAKAEGLKAADLIRRAIREYLKGK